MRRHGVCVGKHNELRHAPRVGKTNSFGVLKLVCLSDSTKAACGGPTLIHTFYHLGNSKACHDSRPEVPGEAEDGLQQGACTFPPSSKLQ